MTARRIIDISQSLGPGTPVWPGEPPIGAGITWEHGPGSPVRVCWLRTSTHGGTHADAPLHYAPDGASTDALDLTPYVGRARVIDVRGCGDLVTVAMVAEALPDPVERVLLRTFERFPHESWPDRFAAIAPEAIDWLAARGVVLVGIDTPSVDPETSKTLDAHHALLRADMRVLEGLVLDHVEPGDYELIALPLRLTGLDAAPVRAVLRTLA